MTTNNTMPIMGAKYWRIWRYKTQERSTQENLEEKVDIWQTSLKDNYTEMCII